MAFVKELPDELVKDILSCFGLISIADTHQICGNISDIVKDRLDICLVDLLPYYKKDRQPLLLRSMKSIYYIQVLRHIVEAAGSRLLSKEFGRKKVLYYNICRFRLDPTNFNISFA